MGNSTSQVFDISILFFRTDAAADSSLPYGKTFLFWILIFPEI
jgi:hypothetical protein